MSGKKWSSEVTIKFLREYEKNPCLWDISTHEYKNRHLRELAHASISEAMDIEDFDSVAVRAKIRSIRNAYALERIKIGKNRKRGMRGYKSKLAWYPVADRILHNVIQSKKSEINKIYVKNEEHSEEETFATTESLSSLYQSLNSLNTFDEISMSAPLIFPKTEIIIDEETDPHTDVNDPLHEQTSNGAIQLPTTARSNRLSTRRIWKPKLCNSSIRAKTRSSITNGNAKTKTVGNLKENSEKVDSSGNDNGYDYFGKFIACQLRKLSEPLALETMSHIQSYITKQRLKSMNSPGNE